MPSFDVVLQRESGEVYMKHKIFPQCFHTISTVKKSLKTFGDQYYLRVFHNEAALGFSSKRLKNLHKRLDTTNFFPRSNLLLIVTEILLEKKGKNQLKN